MKHAESALFTKSSSVWHLHGQVNTLIYIQDIAQYGNIFPVFLFHTSLRVQMTLYAFIFNWLLFASIEYFPNGGLC